MTKTLYLHRFNKKDATHEHYHIHTNHLFENRNGDKGALT